MWKKFYIENIEEHKEFLFYKEEWKDEDTPSGIRIGFVNDGNFYSSFWNPEFDSYDSDEKSKPTHFLEIPIFHEQT